jgi:hypothetical protein
MAVAGGNGHLTNRVSGVDNTGLTMVNPCGLSGMSTVAEEDGGVAS